MRIQARFIFCMFYRPGTLNVLSKVKTFKYMWDNAPFLEARFNRGYSEALKDAIAGAEKLSVGWGEWTKFLSSFARAGDIRRFEYPIS